MSSDLTPPRSGLATLYGVAAGTVIGILIDQLALGIVFGYLIGAMIDSNRRKQHATREAESPTDDNSL